MNNLPIPSTTLMHCAFIKEKFSYLWGKENAKDPSSLFEKSESE